MNLIVECNQCEADFELSLEDLLKEPRKLSCPNCGIKADPDIVEAMATALDEAVAQAARLRRRFKISFGVESDELESEQDDEVALPEVEDDEDSLWGDEGEEESEEEEED
ncbi:MAG: hypothetical protein GYA21_00420 [Myxococcales bacterium]|nr:hypothetical protein [Myxococcales bacterium]